MVSPRSGEITKYGSKVSSKADCRGARTGFVRDNGQSPPATNFAQDEATWRRHVPECRSGSCGFRFPKGTKLSKSVSRTAVGINARRSVNALPQGKAPQGHALGDLATHWNCRIKVIIGGMTNGLQDRPFFLPALHDCLYGKQGRAAATRYYSASFGWMERYLNCYISGFAGGGNAGA